MAIDSFSPRAFPQKKISPPSHWETKRARGRNIAADHADADGITEITQLKMRGMKNHHPALIPAGHELSVIDIPAHGIAPEYFRFAGGDIKAQVRGESHGRPYFSNSSKFAQIG